MAVHDYKNMTEEEIFGLAQKYASKNGFEVLQMKKLPHTSDSYLRYVLAYSEKGQEYATWLLNVEMGGLHYGHYFGHYMMTSKDDAYHNALNDFNKR